MSSAATEPFVNDCVEDVGVGEVDSVFCTPVALSYDHILEQIFDSLGRNDLLNCRLVSHRWLFFAQNPLQKQICLYFNYNKCYNPFNLESAFSKHLTELTALLKKGLSLPDCEFKGHIPIIFPCSGFDFKGTRLSNDDFQQFLNTFGPNIQELYILPFFKEEEVEFPNENIVMDQVANLLLHQAPNLQNIFLAVESAVSWQIEDHSYRSEESELQETDPEYKEICQKASGLLQSVNGSSLKVLHLLGIGFAKLLELIIRISPKLDEIILISERYYKYLIVPENRLWLLKSLEFNLESVENLNVEEMETISYGNFKLRKINIEFGRFNDKEWIQEHPDFEPKIARMLNRIFQGSWDTLEEIQFGRFTFWREMMMPKVMPKVKIIKIWDCRNSETDKNSNATVFPFGFNFEETFPKLRRVHLVNYAERADNVASFSCFLNCLHFRADPCEPLSTSVKTVMLCPMFPFDQEELMNQGELVHTALSPRIQRWFPNAVVEFGQAKRKCSQEPTIMYL